MNDNSTDKILYGVFGLLLIGGAVLLYKFYTLKQSAQGEIAPIVAPAINKAKPKTTKTVPQKPVNTGLGLENVKKIELKPTRREPPALTHEKKINVKSQFSKRRFNKKASINMRWPEELDYIEADIEDGVQSIYGYNHDTGQGLTAMARPAETTIAEIKAYLKENSDGIPNLKGEKLSNISEPQTDRRASRKSGVGDVQFMSANLGKDKSAHIALINRKDKEGSYIFIFTSPRGSLNGNDGYVDQIYNGIQILPRKK